MKNIIILSILLLVVTGCKKNEDFICSITNKSGDQEYTTKIEVDVQNGKVMNATAYMTLNSDEFAQNMCDLLGVTSDADGNLECNGRNITIKNYHKSLSSETLTKEKLIEYLEKQNYSCNSN